MFATGRPALPTLRFFKWSCIPGGGAAPPRLPPSRPENRTCLPRLASCGHTVCQKGRNFLSHVAKGGLAAPPEPPPLLQSRAPVASQSSTWAPCSVHHNPGLRISVLFHTINYSNSNIRHQRQQQKCLEVIVRMRMIGMIAIKRAQP